MNAISFYYRMSSNGLEPAEAADVPTLLKPSTPDSGPLSQSDPTTGVPDLDIAAQVTTLNQQRSGWLIVTVEEYDESSPWYAELKARTETELAKNPAMFRRFKAGGGFQPGKTLRRWRQDLGGDVGEWQVPLTAFKAPLSLKAWADRDPDQTRLRVTSATMWDMRETI